MEISEGNNVEVCSREDGYWGSYYMAQVVAKVGKHKFKVEYLTLVSEKDENKKHREVVDESDIRPCPPQIRVSSFDTLDKVDAYDNDGWWVGRVTGRESEKNYYVYFDSSGDEFVYPVYNLRVHQEWENGQWVPSKRRGYGTMMAYQEQ